MEIIREYVAWDYEDGADPAYYHVFSLDREPGELAIGATLFSITTKDTPEMDAKISALCDGMEEIIKLASLNLESEKASGSMKLLDLLAGLRILNKANAAGKAEVYMEQHQIWVYDVDDRLLNTEDKRRLNELLFHKYDDKQGWLFFG